MPEHIPTLYRSPISMPEQRRIHFCGKCRGTKEQKEAA